MACATAPQSAGQHVVQMTTAHDCQKDILIIAGAVAPFLLVVLKLPSHVPIKHFPAHLVLIRVQTPGATDWAPGATDWAPGPTAQHFMTAATILRLPVYARQGSAPPLLC